MLKRNKSCCYFQKILEATATEDFADSIWISIPPNSGFKHPRNIIARESEHVRRITTTESSEEELYELINKNTRASFKLIINLTGSRTLPPNIVPPPLRPRPPSNSSSNAIATTLPPETNNCNVEFLDLIMHMTSVFNGSLLTTKKERMADDLRIQGNTMYKAKKYEVAIRLYTKSLDLVICPVTLSNRAQAYMDVEKYMEAYTDATNALDLDPLNIKTRFRKAAILVQLGCHDQALHELEFCMLVEPTNANCLAVFAEAKKAQTAHAADPNTGDGFIVVRLDPVGLFLTYHCKLCNCDFSGAKNRLLHLNGRRHELEYNKAKGDTNRASNFLDHLSSSSGQAEFPSKTVTNSSSNTNNKKKKQKKWRKK